MPFNYRSRPEKSASNGAAQFRHRTTKKHPKKSIKLIHQMNSREIGREICNCAIATQKSPKKRQTVLLGGISTWLVIARHFEPNYFAIPPKIVFSRSFPCKLMTIFKRSSDGWDVSGSAFSPNDENTRAHSDKKCTPGLLIMMHSVSALLGNCRGRD